MSLWISSTGELTGMIGLFWMAVFDIRNVPDKILPVLLDQIEIPVVAGVFTTRIGRWESVIQPFEVLFTRIFLRNSHGVEVKDVIIRF